MSKESREGVWEDMCGEEMRMPDNVYIDGSVKKWDSIVRRPYYRLRGAPVTEEQALEIIRRTDTFFSYRPDMDDIYTDYICPLNFAMCWFYSNWYPGKTGWVHPDGTVGENGIMGKYPNTGELIEEWSEYARNFPFLDLVVAITWWNEVSAEHWEKSQELMQLHDNSVISREEYLKRQSELRYSDPERKDFEKNIETGVWVHGGMVEIMDGNRTADKYLEYERLYEATDSRIYIPGYYREFQPDVAGRKYLFKCMAAYGIDDPEKVIREHYRPYEVKGLL